MKNFNMSVDTNGLKNIEIMLLKELLAICNKHNIQYFALGGTCLGAVRHKGFIPWDDDIDIGMPRKHYNQFLSIAQAELPPNIFLQTNVTEKEYPMNFAKLRNCDTTFIETSLKCLNLNHGVYIDIFPLDGVPTGKVTQKIRNIRDSIYKYEISKAYYLEHLEGANKKKKNVLALCVKFGIDLFYPNYKVATLKRERMIQKYAYDKCDIVTNYCGAWGEKETVPKDYFDAGVRGTFEGLSIMLPQKYHEYLTNVYGNYMTLPPLDKRISHHYCTIIDLNKSYKEYLK